MISLFVSWLLSANSGLGFFYYDPITTSGSLTDSTRPNLIVCRCSSSYRLALHATHHPSHEFASSSSSVVREQLSPLYILVAPRLVPPLPLYSHSGYRSPQSYVFRFPFVTRLEPPTYPTHCIHTHSPPSRPLPDSRFFNTAPLSP